MTKPAAWQFGETSHFRKNPPVRSGAKGWRPLYAEPKLTRWIDLTEEEANRLYNSDVWERGQELIYLAQAMLKEKNFGR